MAQPLRGAPACGAPTAPSAVRALAAARAALGEAVDARDPAERFAAAHLSALRAAAAVLADRALPGPARRRPASAWSLLAVAAPELAPWARYFAAGADQRIAAQAGVRDAVSAAAAERLLHDALDFLAVVETTLAVLPAEVRRAG